jgi:hypothetical protein
VRENMKQLKIVLRRTNYPNEVIIREAVLVARDEEKANGEIVFSEILGFPISTENLEPEALESEFVKTLEKAQEWTSESRRIFEGLKRLSEKYKIPMEIEKEEDC